MSEILDTILLNTSLVSDIQSSEANLSISGLRSVHKPFITSMRQVKYKAEVVQVVKVGYSGYTPAGSTLYKVEIGDTNRTKAGMQETLVPYSYLTPDDITQLGATAALQREAIHAALITKINATTGTNYITAASLLTGTGFTITDSAGYFPINAQTMTNRKGASTVLPCQNGNGSGFLSTDWIVTTPAVYSFGVGTDLNTAAPVIDNMYGNLIQGNLIEPPLTSAGAKATSGQNYDGFVITSKKFVPAPNGQRGEEWFTPRTQTIYVDNGTGTSTTNLTGFTAFEREFLRHMTDLYRNDPSAIFDFFDQSLNASSTYPTTGLAVTTTDNVVMAVESTNNLFTWYVNPIGSHTIITPIVSTGGVSLVLDATDEKGMELSAPNLTQSPKEFIVGKTEYSFYARVTATNFLHLEEFAFGLRKKAAYAVNLVAYDVASADFAALGVVSEAVDGLIKIQTSKAAGGVVASTTAGTWTSGAHDLLITVDMNGNVKFFLDSVDVTSKQAVNYVFTAGTHLIPFIDAVLDSNTDAAPLLIQTAALPSINWRS